MVSYRHEGRGTQFLIGQLPLQVNKNGGDTMTEKQKLVDYILNLTEEQVDKICSRFDLLERYTATAESQAIHTDHLTGKLFVSEGVEV